MQEYKEEKEEKGSEELNFADDDFPYPSVEELIAAGKNITTSGPVFLKPEPVFIEIEDSDHEQEKIYGTDQFASST